MISECFRGLHYSARLSYNEAFREMQDRLEVKESRPGNTMTNYRSRLGFCSRGLVGSPIHNICKSHVSKPRELITLQSTITVLIPLTAHGAMESSSGFKSFALQKRRCVA